MHRQEDEFWEAAGGGYCVLKGLNCWFWLQQTSEKVYNEEPI